jgi:CO dehydrogenase nickel-insertion accessory protein CooC1
MPKPLTALDLAPGLSDSSLILVDDAAGALAPADRGVERDNDGVVVVCGSVATAVALARRYCPAGVA